MKSFLTPGGPIFGSSTEGVPHRPTATKIFHFSLFKGFP
nr:MAG TPA: hypothetical protein [Caudoviricetes sp.]